MTRWIRAQQDEMPAMIRINFGINTSKHPELARFLHSLEFGTASDTIRAILEQYLGVASKDVPHLEHTKGIKEANNISQIRSLEQSKKSVSNVASVEKTTHPHKAVQSSTGADGNPIVDAKSSDVMDEETSDWIADLDRALG